MTPDARMNAANILISKTTDKIKRNVSLCFFFFLSQCCAYGLVRLGLGTVKYLVRVKKTSCLATTAGDGLSSTENIWFCRHKTAGNLLEVSLKIVWFHT